MLTQAMSRTYVAELLESKEPLKVGAGPHLCKAGLSLAWLCDELPWELWWSNMTLRFWNFGVNIN